MAASIGRAAAAREAQSLASYTYGLLLVAGGVLQPRHAKGSTAALVAGIACGALVAGLEAGFVAADRAPKRWRRARLTLSLLLTALSVLVTYVTGMRYAASQRFMPGGFIALVSVGASAIYFRRVMDAL